MTKDANILSLAKAWALKNKLIGPQAFLRFVMFNFVEILSQASDDFVFKGGNLLWVYIKTPRSTIDLDFVTLESNSDATVKSILKKVCSHSKAITFKVKDYKTVISLEKRGANVVIEYETKDGARNQFELDIVFSVETDVAQIKSPLHEEKFIKSATLENIIADKLAACARFGAGNTRMKDYDDLWRLSQSDMKLKSAKLKTILKRKKLDASLNISWIGPDLEKSWKNHQKQYKDLPPELMVVFRNINTWLEGLVG